MDAVGTFLDTYYYDEMRTVWYVIGSYVALYVLAFVLSRLFISLRSAGQPPVDVVVRRLLLVCFLAVTALPVFYIVQIIMQGTLATSWHRFIPYAFYVLLNILALAAIQRARISPAK